LTTILIHSNTSDNKLLEMLQKLSMFDIYVDKFITMSKEKETIYEADLLVKDLEHLNKVILELNKFPYVTKVERLMK